MKIECEKGQHLIILDRGQPLVQTLTHLATTEKWGGGQFQGLGALMNVELGYYHLEKKEYVRKVFDAEDYELISLVGNLSQKDTGPFVHVHASLGASDFSVFGGHLFEAEVAVTAEICFTPFGVTPQRQPNPSIGLDLICGIQ